MDAGHGAGAEMADMMAYAASVGGRAARRDVGAAGFIGNTTDATAHYFGNDKGFGTMPHALFGYAGPTLKAAELYAETFPGEQMTVLIEYSAQEVNDAIAVIHRFPDASQSGQPPVRPEMGTAASRGR